MTEPDAAGGPQRERGRRGPEGLSPVRAFFVVGAIAAIVPLAFFATREEATPAETPGAVRSPDFSLTDEEAIAEFERLHALQVAAYENRDVSLIPGTYTRDSPVAKTIEREITQLLRDDVVTTMNFSSRSLAVLSNTSDEVVLRQSVVVRAAFFNTKGDEVSTPAPAELQQVRWILQRSGSNWLIHDAVVIKSRPIEKSGG